MLLAVTTTTTVAKATTFLQGNNDKSGDHAITFAVFVVGAVAITVVGSALRGVDRPVAQFIALMFEPLPWLGDVAGRIVTSLAFLGVTVTSAGVSVWPAGTVAFLGALAILLLVAGLRLQYEIRSRDRIEFDLFPHLEPQGGLLAYNHRAFGNNVMLTVSVKNEGTTSDFAARVVNVAGIDDPSTGLPCWGANYGVALCPWLNSTNTRVEIIGSGGENKIMLANVGRQVNVGAQGNRVFWFWTGELGHEGVAGNQYVMDEIGVTGDVVIEFDVKVVNIIRGKDHPRSERFRVTFPAAADAPVEFVKLPLQSSPSTSEPQPTGA